MKINTETFLELVRTEKTIRQRIVKHDMSITQTIYSYVNDPNCTCKKDLIEWILKNNTFVESLVEEMWDIIKSKIPQDPVAIDILDKSKATKPTSTPTKVTSENKPISKILMGEVHEIEPDPDQYKLLIQQSLNEGWLYRGVNVVPVVKDGKDVWLVFFY